MMCRPLDVRLTARSLSSTSGSVADTAGLETGDVVRKVNRQTTRTAAEAMKELRRMPTGGTAFVLIWRDGDELLVELPTE